MLTVSESVDLAFLHTPTLLRAAGEADTQHIPYPRMEILESAALKVYENASFYKSI